MLFLIVCGGQFFNNLKRNITIIMININQLRPTPKQMLNHIDEFEDLCLGKKYYTPSKFREINEELSIGAVLMLGKHRYETSNSGTRLFWRGLDNHEHDMGLTHDVRVMRDYPGFNAKRSKSLNSNSVSDSKVITHPSGKGSISVVTMQDGSKGIGHNYRIALRNATLRMHLKSKCKYDLFTQFLNFFTIKA